MAQSHVRDSHGKLLYVVLLASLHKAGKGQEAATQGQPGQEGEGQQEEGQKQQEGEGAVV
jgi:hypothetical protein